MKNPILSKHKKSVIVLGLFLFAIVSMFSGTVGANTSDTKTLDYTEGGHLETDFDVFFMSEWWYLNGKATMIADDGDIKDVGFFVVFGHTESPSIITDGIQLSHLSAFHGLYLEDENEFEYVETFIPRSIVGNFITLHTPYVSYAYPGALKTLSGSANSGYYMNYVSENFTSNLSFEPETDNTIDQAGYPSCKEKNTGLQVLKDIWII
jgi:hypothetical protein